MRRRGGGIGVAVVWRGFDRRQSCLTFSLAILSTHIADTLLSFSVIMSAAVLDTVSVMLLQSSNFEAISLVKGSPRPQPHGDDAFNHYSRAGNQSLPTSWRG